VFIPVLSVHDGPVLSFSAASVNLLNDVCYLAEELLCLLVFRLNSMGIFSGL